MPIVINNAEQEQCITPAEAVEVLEHGYRLWQRGDAIRRGTMFHILPTLRSDEQLMFSSMEGGLRAPGYYALRIQPQIGVVPGSGRQRMRYTWKVGYHGGLIFLFSTDTAELMAILNDGYVQHLRVAATAAMGVKYMAREDSHVLGIIGSGGMARTFAQTIPEARDIQRIQAWSPNRDRLEAYVAEMKPKVACEIVALDGPEAVCKGADILCACTSSFSPVVEAGWVAKGTHLNNVLPAELGTVYPRVDTAGLLVDKKPVTIGTFDDCDFAIRYQWMSWMGGTPEERARVPIDPPTPNPYPNARYVKLIEWETGERYKRSRDEISILSNHSYGTYPGDVTSSSGPQGIQFATVGGRIYDNAVKRGNIGQHLPRELFLQDTYTYSPGTWREKGSA
jgi:ornithine cyclodeaminase/alanine dehydrogenase-like protein (mu-crystallin family)